MRFRRWLGLLAVVLLWGNLSTAKSGQTTDADVTVLVYVSARVTPATLGKAELEAARIFRSAGVRIAWVHCSSQFGPVGKECKMYSNSNALVLHIVPNGKVAKDSIFGMAFLAEDGNGRYSDVFYDRVELAHRKFGADVPRLLGAVAAHELGHLLLGSHAHSWSGIMAPSWGEDSMQNLDMGTLLFTADQASLMKARMNRDEVKLAGAGMAPANKVPIFAFVPVP